MSTKKSTVITNNEAKPQILNLAGNHGGRVRVACGSFELADEDLADADVILFAELPANAVILSLEFMNDDLDTGATETLAPDIGLYEPDGSTVADVDAFASATTLFEDANTVWIDVLAEAGTAAVAKIGKRLFDWAGDSQGDFASYFIAWTLTGSGGSETAVGETIAYKITYAVD